MRLAIDSRELLIEPIAKRRRDVSHARPVVMNDQV
jgi:hypothetical protein